MVAFYKQMANVLDRYAAEVDPEPTSLDPVAAWAVRQGLYQPRPRDVVQMCKEELAESLRQVKRIDSKGRKYRAKRCVRTNVGGAQLTLWADADTAPRSFMEKSIAQTRKAVADDCFQLKMDVDHFNDERGRDQPIKLVLNFTEDVAEMEAAERAEKKKGPDAA